MFSAAPAYDHRRDTRYDVVQRSIVPIIVGRDNGGIVLDLARAGLALHAVGRLHKGTACDLEIYLPDSARPVIAIGEIAWSNEAKIAGIRFIDLPEQSHQRLLSWLATVSPEEQVSAPELQQNSTAALEPQQPACITDPPVSDVSQNRTALFPKRGATHKGINKMAGWVAAALLCATVLGAFLRLNHRRNIQVASPQLHQFELTKSPTRQNGTIAPTLSEATRAVQVQQQRSARQSLRLRQHTGNTATGSDETRDSEDQEIIVRHYRNLSHAEQNTGDPDVVVRHWKNGHWQ